MTTDDDKYLSQVLDSQAFKEEDPELKDLREHRAAIEGILMDAFKGDKPTIKYGGSKAKGTMLKEAYDLDILFYLPNEEAPSLTLQGIYDGAKNALSKTYVVEEKTCAIRLRDKGSQADFHIDVVPGRFTNEAKDDVFLHQTSGSKERLKTNPDVHIRHVKDSGVIDGVKLIKLWRIRNGLEVRSFVLELAAVDVLKKQKDKGLGEQLRAFFGVLATEIESIKVEDPANHTGNDLSPLLSDEVRGELQRAAKKTLEIFKKSGWRGVFGNTQVADEATKQVVLPRAVSSAPAPAKPWACQRGTGPWPKPRA